MIYIEIRGAARWALRRSVMLLLRFGSLTWYVLHRSSLNSFGHKMMNMCTTFTVALSKQIVFQIDSQSPMREIRDWQSCCHAWNPRLRLKPRSLKHELDTQNRRVRSYFGHQSPNNEWDPRPVIKVRSISEIQERSSKSDRWVRSKIDHQSPIDAWGPRSVIKARSMSNIQDRSSKSDR